MLPRWMCLLADCLDSCSGLGAHGILNMCCFLNELQLLPIRETIRFAVFETLVARRVVWGSLVVEGDEVAALLCASLAASL